MVKILVTNTSLQHVSDLIVHPQGAVFGRSKHVHPHPDTRTTDGLHTPIGTPQLPNTDWH
jgi:hypothetical protein